MIRTCFHFSSKVGHAIRDQRAIRQRKLRKKEKVSTKNLCVKRSNDHEELKRYNHVMDEDFRKGTNSHAKGDDISQIFLTANKMTEVDSVLAAQRAVVREQLKRELFLSSIKKKQALARELAALQQETSLLAALEASDTPSSTLIEMMARGEFRTLTGSLPLWG